ncbi:MAG: hypothetical protein AB1635_03690, partial [Acidobacteriota bacterium]
TAGGPPPARGRDRWVINKIRALSSWYTKGFEGGGTFRTRVNGVQSLSELRDLIEEFFLEKVPGTFAAVGAVGAGR